MAEELKNNAGATAEAPKKHRRGISNETQAVNQLRFHEKDAVQQGPAAGLFVGHLADVKVDWSVGGDNTSFAGLKMPRLTFHFTSNHTNALEQRHAYKTLFPVESNVATIPGGSDEWRVTSVLNWIKHFLDIYYLKGRNMTDAEEDALALPFEDFDEDNNYVAIDPEEVLKGYASMFTNVASIMNGTFNVEVGETPKPCYKDANGKYITVWIKLLRCRKVRKGSEVRWVDVNRGELDFDSFVGNGAIELQKTNTPPAILRFDPSRESIIPQDTKRQPTLGGQSVPGMMGGAVMVGMPMGMPADNSAFAAATAEGDMPF